MTNEILKNAHEFAFLFYKVNRDGKATLIKRALLPLNKFLFCIVHYFEGKKCPENRIQCISIKNAQVIWCLILYVAITSFL